MPDPAVKARTIRVLLVQCCNLPQWIYVWRRLEARHPDWRIEGLAVGEQHTRYLVERFLPGRTVHDQDETLPTSGFQKIVYPLLNRGYWKLKSRARHMDGAHLSVDFEGNLEDLSRRDLFGSVVVPRNQPTPEFAEFVQRFPHRPLSGRILLIESASERHVRKAEAGLQELIREGSELTRIGRRGSTRFRPSLLRRPFDWTVVFWTGETGYALLKLLAVLPRTGRLMIVDERGTHISGSVRSVAGFILRRLRFGIDWRYARPRILFVQTESRQYVHAALEALQEPRLFPGARVLLLCRAEDEADLADAPGVVRTVRFPQKSGVGGLWRLWRALHEFDPELSCALFSGRPIFRREKLIFFVLCGRFNFVLNARLDGYWLTPSTMRRVFRREPIAYSRLGIAERVLLVQTETPIYVRKAAERLEQPELAPGAELSILCRAEDRSLFDDLAPPERIYTYRRGQSLLSLARLWNRLRERDFSVKAAIFTGRPVFRPGKLLYFLAPSAARLIFNAQLETYWLKLRNVRRLFRQEPLLFSEHGSGVRIVLFQTEVPAYVKAAHARLLGSGLYPGARIFLICREEDRTHFEELEGVEQIRTVSRDSTLRELLGHWGRIRRFKPQVYCALFTGRPIFRRAKLFALATGFRRLLIINAGLDSYWLRPSTLRRPFRQEPLLFGEAQRRPTEVLLIETEAVEEMRRAIRILGEPHVVHSARITVFCRHDRAAQYDSLPNVVGTVTYSGRSVDDLRTIARLLGTRSEIAAAVFSGRRIFLKQKILFWLLRARGRLLFNHALDCRYLTRRDLSVLLKNRGSEQSLFEQMLRQTVKALLFLPRFAYLLLWAWFAGRRRTRFRNATYEVGKPGSREA